MHRILTLLLLFISFGGFGQTLPSSRSVDWTLAGLRDTTTNGFTEIDMLSEGMIGDGITPNDLILDVVLSSIADSGAILIFPAGNFLFNNTINLPNKCVIKGDGAKTTTFTFDLGGSGHSFNINGQAINADTTSIIESAIKDSNFVIVSNPTNFSTGDWMRIIQYDTDLVTSSWAEKTVGQIVKIKSISTNKIVLESPLRMNYDISRSPYILRINPAKNVGIECLKIKRLDNTAPEQSSNINFSYAVNCWVNGIESENCTFSHVKSNFSSNLHISKSYFHHGFEYGGNGRAYGVMLQMTTNECLVENNIFEHLRHSMIVQAGANGNVFAYNYSFDPFWESTPNNSAGDVVLHGNYVYTNLFEQNNCQNIVIDNSHGPNGPHNTFFRNRSERYGIFFSSTNSPDQNFLGNEIPNTGLPYSFVNYTILGSGHFIHGNNNKGSIHPSGTEILPDESYTYTQLMDYIPSLYWAGIGTPNTMGENSIPAFERYISGNIFSYACGDISAGIDQTTEFEETIFIYPNPVESKLTIESAAFIEKMTVIDVAGHTLQSFENIGFSAQLTTQNWKNGVYFLLIDFTDRTSLVEKVVKAN